jgi:hypothetical protein
MEVHAHTHTPRKKWTHYFWEFLMLFLAVFCGFLAEYQLEHKIEKGKEKQFIQSLMNDLKADTANIAQLNSFRLTIISHIESLVSLLTSDSVQKKGFATYKYARSVSRRAFFYSADGTLQQLKNSGGLRLINKKNVADSINGYDVLYRSILTIQQLEENQVIKYREMASQILDARILTKLFINDISDDSLKMLNPMLKQYNPLLLNEFTNSLLYRRGNSYRIYQELGDLYRKAANLIELIKNEYHLSEGTPLEK